MQRQPDSSREIPTVSPQAQTAAQLDLQIEARAVGPVQQEISDLEELIGRPDMPPQIKRHYKLAVRDLKQFIREIKAGQDPRAAYQSHIIAARQHIGEAQWESINLLQQQAGAVVDAYQTLRPGLTKSEQEKLQPQIDILTRCQQGTLLAEEVKLASDALAVMGKALPLIARAVQERGRAKLLSSIRQVRQWLSALNQEARTLQVDGQKTFRPLFGGIGAFLGLSREVRNTTVSDKLRDARNPEFARSIGELRLSLDELEKDVRSGRPLSPDRLRDLQRIAQNPAIARTQDAIELELKIAPIIEASQEIAMASAVIVVAGFAAEAAVGAVVLYAGTSTLASVGAFLTGAAVFNAVDIPLQAAAGVNEWPKTFGELGQRVAVNTIGYGAFKAVGKGFESVFGRYQQTSRFLYPVGRGLATYETMVSFDLGLQLATGVAPEVVFSAENIGQKTVGAIPMLLGLEAVGHLSRPVLGPIMGRIGEWRNNRLRSPEPAERSTEATEVTEVTGQVINPGWIDTEAATLVPRNVTGEMRGLQTEYYAARLRFENNPTREGFEKLLELSHKSDALLYKTRTEAEAGWTKYIEKKERLLKLQSGNDPLYRGRPLFEIDGLDQAQAVWDSYKGTEESKALDAKYGKNGKPLGLRELIIKDNFENAERFSRNENIEGKSHNRLLQKLNEIRLAVKGIGQQAELEIRGVKPEWFRDTVTLDATSFRQDLWELSGKNKRPEFKGEDSETIQEEIGQIEKIKE